MFEPQFIDRAAALVVRCAEVGLSITTAESCTGGLVGALLTEIAGSSGIYGFGFITYANEAKTEMLGVPSDVLVRHGAVSAQTAEAMAWGALARSGASMAIAITGIAGPGGGSAAKPVGLVWFGLALRGGACRVVERQFGGLGRAAVRRQAVLQALELLEDGVARQVGSPP